MRSALDRSPAAALLEIARLVQDADVDPVAGDDADEEPGGDVEVTDEICIAEGPDEADADGDPHDEERPQAHEVEEDDGEDEPEARSHRR